MPDMDDIEAAREICREEPIPVILVTAFHDPEYVERAKGILMKRAGLDEPEAFRRLQKLASSKSQKLVEIARTIITAEEAYSINEAPPGADTH